MELADGLVAATEFYGFTYYDGSSQTVCPPYELAPGDTTRARSGRGELGRHTTEAIVTRGADWLRDERFAAPDVI